MIEPCKAEDRMRDEVYPCQPVEGKRDGKVQYYCSRCGRKMDPPEQGAM